MTTILPRLHALLLASTLSICSIGALANVGHVQDIEICPPAESFGDIVTKTSPDRGATAISVDGAGRPVTRTDALNRIATTQWDALDRPTRIAYSDQTHTYTWDSCTNGVGHLCSVTDAAGGTAFSYDTQGRVTQKTQTIGAAQLLQTATYDSHSRLATLTLPSGWQLAYGYDSQGRLASISVDGVSILASATYRPFGPVSGWTWGNGATSARSFDLDGRITAVTLGAGTKSTTFDAAGRVTLAKASGSRGPPGQAMELRLAPHSLHHHSTVFHP